MRCALVCLLVAACTDTEPTFVDGEVSLLLTGDDPADATFRDLDLVAYRETHMHGDTTETAFGVDLRLAIDGVEIPADSFEALLPTLRGYPDEIFVLADDERQRLALVPFFTASVEVTETVYRVTFDPPIQDGENAVLQMTTATGYKPIQLPVGATTGEAPRAEARSLSMSRSKNTSFDAEGLRIGGDVFVARVLVMP